MCGDSNWGLTDAIVACRQLGLPVSGAATLNLAHVSDSARVSWLRNVGCFGTENSLFNCNVRPSEIICNSPRYAGVSCQDSKL